MFTRILLYITHIVAQQSREMNPCFQSLSLFLSLTHTYTHDSLPPFSLSHTHTETQTHTPQSLSVVNTYDLKSDIQSPTKSVHCAFLSSSLLTPLILHLVLVLFQITFIYLNQGCI